MIILYHFIKVKNISLTDLYPSFILLFVNLHHGLYLQAI